MRDPHSAAGRLATQFVESNQPQFSALGVQAATIYDGQDVRLTLAVGNVIGAIPLISPTTARADFGLVIQPRFPWKGIGPMLAEMGWRVSPAPLRMPVLRRSERRVPPWVLSSMILTRLNHLLDTLDRRFEMVSEDRAAPRGRVDWATYATARLPRAQALAIPCVFPDLREDRLLKGAVRFTVEQQIQSLETQKGHGAYVHQLIDFARNVWQRVQSVPAHLPAKTTVETWLRRPMQSQHFTDGLIGMQWSIEERGLAGTSDLAGIPWRMPMDLFFEAWIERVLGEVSRKTGGRLKIGRTKQTVHPIDWNPPYLGSQRSLVPDFWIEYENLAVIVDAKYKRHWEEIGRASWRRVEEMLREQHRQDLLQVLAYGSLASTPTVILCLVYPCSADNWESLKQRGRLHHRAAITIGARTIRLWLTAIPMELTASVAAAPMAKEIGRLLTNAESE